MNIIFCRSTPFMILFRHSPMETTRVDPCSHTGWLGSIVLTLYIFGILSQNMLVGCASWLVMIVCHSWHGARAWTVSSILPRCFWAFYSWSWRVQKWSTILVISARFGGMEIGDIILMISLEDFGGTITIHERSQEGPIGQYHDQTLVGWLFTRGTRYPQPFMNLRFHCILTTDIDSEGLPQCFHGSPSGYVRHGKVKLEQEACLGMHSWSRAVVSCLPVSLR